MSLDLEVECYSGHKADEKPTRFGFEKSSSPPHEVLNVLDQWYGPGYQCFKVLADDGNLYILRHSFDADSWSLDSYRAGSRC